MIPSQPTKSSRRSSILKISKSLSSLQHGGDSNTSSVENSPTVATAKLKRRVSFAEKKHVKEFCDSIEQGTVWDNTYEESESSQMKTNQSDKFVEISQLSSVNHYQLQSLSNVEVPSSLIVENKTRSLSNPILIHQNAFDHQFSSREIVSDLHIKTQQSIISSNPEFLANKENIPAILKLSTEESSLVGDEEIFRCQNKSSITNPSPGFSIYCDDEMETENEGHLNSSNHENVSMDCTMLAGNSLLSSICTETCNNINFINNKDEHRSENCMDNAPFHARDKGKSTEPVKKMQVFYDNAMEMTEAVNVMWLPQSQKLQPKLAEFHDKSMEFTECVSTFNNHKLPIKTVSSETLKPVQVIDEENQTLHDELKMAETISSSGVYRKSEHFDKEITQVFHDKSMEMTEVVSNVRLPLKFSCMDEEKTQVFHNKSMEMTEVVPNMRFSVLPSLPGDEKTLVFHNRSMEMTIAVPNIRYSAVPGHLGNEKTRVFHDKSMEMTEVVSNVKLPLKFSCMSEEKARFFNDKSMEITRTVPNMRFSVVPSLPGNEETQVFHNKSMEMTEAVSNMRYSVMPTRPGVEITRVFQNKSMEMTEMGSNVKLPLKFSCMSEEKERFFHDKSMEMTEAVPNAKFPLKFSCMDKEKTQVFHNKSMEMTEAVANMKFSVLPNHLVDDITQVFHDKSMEMTEAMTSSRSTKESTDAIPPLMLPQDSISTNCPTDLSPQAEIDHNYFMELTEAFQSLKRPYSSIVTENKSSSAFLSPNVKNSRSSLILEEKKNISEKDLEKLHQLLHQDSNKTNSSIPTEFSQPNYFTQMTNVVSSDPSTNNDYDAMEMSGVISFSQEKQNCLDEIQNINSISVKAVDILDESKELKHIISTSLLPVDKSSESLNNCSHLYVSKETDLFKENQLSRFIKPSQSDDCDTTERTETPKLIQAEPSHDSMLKTPNSLQIFNKIVSENPILLESENNSIERVRYRSKFVNNANIENDVTYEITKPIIQQKEVEKDNFLEFEEAPSFIYDQSISEKYQTNKAQIKEFYEPQIPDITFTEKIDQVFLNKAQENQIVNILPTITTTNICNANNFPTQPEREQMIVDEDKNEVQLFDEVVFDKYKYNEYKEVKTTNRRNTFLIKENDYSLTNVMEPNIQCMVECDKEDIIDQCNDGKSVSLHIDGKIIDNGGYLKENVVEQKNEKMVEKKNCSKNNIENTISRPSISINLSKIYEKNQSNYNQLFSNNMVSKKRKKENIKDSIKKTDKYACQSVISEHHSIIEKITQTEKNYIDLRNKTKYKFSLRMNKTEANRTEGQPELKDASESLTEGNVYKRPYEILEEGLKTYEKEDDCIWQIYAINPKTVCIEYYKTALLLLISLYVPDSEDELEHITKVNIISRLKDEEPTILKVTDRLIMQRINTQIIRENYTTYEDIPILINYVTNEVKFINDFYDDLEKLSRIYLMDISEDRISFNVRTKHISTILKISMNLTFFPQIRSEDIEVVCLLGSINENDVKLLMEHIKPNSKFLSTYIRRVEDLLNLLEESNLLAKKKRRNE